MERIDDKATLAVTPFAKALSTARLRTHAAGVGACGLPWPACRSLADDTLMARVADGDPHAFAVLYHRHVRAAASLAAQMCPRAAIAEEVVQEAFLSFWRSRRHFDRRRGSVRAWVLGIVRNRAIDVLRQGIAHEVAGSTGHGMEDAVSMVEPPEGEVSRRERSRELLAALDGLPPEQSRVITLAYYGGYTHTEIATMLNTPIGTVKGRMRLGLRKMAVNVPATI